MKKIILAILAFYVINVGVANAAFVDVKEFSEGNKAITWMEENGIVEGYAGDEFRPETYVSRAEFLKMLYATLGEDDFSNTEMITSETFTDLPNYDTRFTDIPGYEMWYIPYLSKAYNDGVIDGYPDGTVKPGQTINFAEVSKIIGNAFFDLDLNYTDDWHSEYGACVLDQKYYTGEWYRKFIAVLDSSCIYPDSTIAETGPHAGNSVTREQMAIMLYRAKAIKDNSSDNKNLEVYGGGMYPQNIIAENEFAYRAAEPGMKVGEWTIKEVGPYSKNDANISFTGEVEISGEYSWDLSSPIGPQFIPDEESKNKLPKLHNDDSEHYVFFGDYYRKSDADNLDDSFGPIGSSGTATVIVDFYDYKYNSGYRVKSFINLYKLISKE